MNNKANFHEWTENEIIYVVKEWNNFQTADILSQLGVTFEQFKNLRKLLKAQGVILKHKSSSLGVILLIQNLITEGKI